jgi:hypothetical protein
VSHVQGVMAIEVCADCPGQSCETYHEQMDREKTMGMSLRFNEPSLEKALAIFDEAFTKSSASDADGVARSVPDGTAFTVHTFAHSPESDGEWAGVGAWVYCALYSGPVPPEEYLRNAPAWPDRPVQQEIANVQGL